MELLEAISKRHAVRSYLDKAIEPEKISAIEAKIDSINKDAGLHIQLVKDEPKAFAGGLFSYGSFKGVKNYLVMVGPKGKDEEIGYYGEEIVLLATTLGLSSCWVAMTYKKEKNSYTINKGEKLYLVVSLGYGSTTGFAHKSKDVSALSNYKDGDPV